MNWRIFKVCESTELIAAHFTPPKAVKNGETLTNLEIGRNSINSFYCHKRTKSRWRISEFVDYVENYS